jgi:hypothetical protein
MKSLESLPALVSRLEAALGEASRPLQKPEKMPLQVSDDDGWSEFRYATMVVKGKSPILKYISFHCTFSDKVSSLNLRLSVEPTFALVHPGPGEGVHFPAINLLCPLGHNNVRFYFSSLT